MQAGPRKPRPWASLAAGLSFWGWRCRNQERRPVAMGQAASLTAPGDGHSSAAKSKISSSYSRGYALNRIPLQRGSTVLRGRRPPIRNLGRRLARESGKIFEGECIKWTLTYLYLIMIELLVPLRG